MCFFVCRHSVCVLVCVSDYRTQIEYVCHCQACIACLTISHLSRRMSILKLNIPPECPLLLNDSKTTLFEPLLKRYVLALQYSLTCLVVACVCCTSFRGRKNRCGLLSPSHYPHLSSGQDSFPTDCSCDRSLLSAHVCFVFFLLSKDIFIMSNGYLNPWH